LRDGGGEGAVCGGTEERGYMHGIDIYKYIYIYTILI
jgi:hypothetical protein